MHGIPKVLQTRTDFTEVEAMVAAGETYPKALAAHYRGLLEQRYQYVFDRKLADGEAPDGDMPAYCVTADPETGVRSQLRREDDPDAFALRLGFTWAEIDARIAALEEM